MNSYCLADTMISFCLFISLSGKKNINNIVRANMLIKSLSKFANERVRLYIICPRKESKRIELNIKNYNNIQYTFINDEDIIQNIDSYRDCNSWYIQQVLKLSVSKYIDTDFYLIFDSDIICCREFFSSSFIKNKRSFVSYTEAKNCYDWYKGSSILLQLDKICEDDLIMDVTPNIFSKVIANETLGYIENLYKQDANSFLLEHTILNWSEYTLYYLFARHSGLFNKFHIDFLNEEETYPQNYMTSNYCLWRNSSDADLENLDIHKIQDEKSFFLVVQSTTHFTMNEIGKKFKDFLN